MDQIRQRLLGPMSLVAFIAIWSGFAPLSNDMYLPALPAMTGTFDSSPEQVNLTLTTFFIFFALGTIVWGLLSDQYGRKPILIAGLGLYILASGLCALASTLDSLIVWRAVQAIGAGAAGAVGTAVIKDVYSGKRRESVLAIVQSLILISPAAGPILGAFLLTSISWQGIFWVMAGIGVAALAGGLLFEESITERSSANLFQSLGRPVTVLRNRSFTMLLVLFSLANLSGIAFIASSSYIYQDNFHLSRQVFSFYFSFNALGMITGPMIYLWLARRFHAEAIIVAGYITIAVSGLLVCFLGNSQPWVFALCILPASIAVNLLRPPSVHMMLEQQNGDVGTVASLINASGLLVGSLGVQLISLPWGNTIIALGIMTFTTAAISLLAWPFVVRRVTRMPGPDRNGQAASGLPVQQ
jgi:DHA1 family bicyclomycin/chloramphenicol resistance-like MFS transporter